MSLELLDIAAVIRTAQTIAGEVDLERVLDRFMRIVIENAGAQAGSLILEREQNLVVEVQVSASSNTISVGLDSPLESRSDLPISVVKYVARTSEGVVLSDAASDARFMNDPYIWVHRPRSILCLPMAHQGRLIGVLYLENNATKDAFPAARLELLKLLASLSAIAVENARLYSYVQHRTEELHDTEVQLQRELRERERAEAERAALQEEIIQVQNARLAEMSTPIIPITDRIMVMPLIGTMDRQRAQQVLTTALQGVQSHRAEVVIIDITGVKLVDTDVASTLIGTAGALRMLGAHAVITGIRPDVAQALISLDVDFSAMVTLGTLQNGIAYALGRTGEARTIGLGRRSR
jgi:GAF domain-containing protein/ABC-type transporter Mla MlaB component